MPALAGIVADRWVNAEKLFGMFHLAGAFTLLYIPQVDNPSLMFWVMLLNMVFYAPTISLSTTVSYSTMKDAEVASHVVHMATRDLHWSLRAIAANLLRSAGRSKEVDRGLRRCLNDPDRYVRWIARGSIASRSDRVAPR